MQIEPHSIALSLAVARSLVEAYVVVLTAWCASCEVPLGSSPATLTGI